MDKLSSPFKDGRIMITQTTHDNKGGSNFDLVRAIDCNKDPFDNNVYAEGDGTVIKVVDVGNPNSYIWLHYDGMPDYIYREFVHCRPRSSLKVGDRVTRGYKVGQLEPYKADWYGVGKHHYVHLHWSFYNKNKDGAPNPFNYLDRTTPVGTNYSVIRNDPVWFKSNGDFNWDSFGDYKLELDTEPEPEPPTDDCTECEQKLLEASKTNEKLEEDIRQLQTENETLESENEELQVVANAAKEYVEAANKLNDVVQ